MSQRRSDTCRTARQRSSRLGDPLVLSLTTGFIAVFVVYALLDGDAMSAVIASGFSWTARTFGAYFQLLLLLTFFVSIGIAIAPMGRARMGDRSEPEMSTFKWLSIIMCTLLAGGGVFFAAGEPVYHYLNTPPNFSSIAGTPQAIPDALAQSFMHWGFLAWTVLGALTSLVLAQAHYIEGQPLKPRTLLYPVLGQRLVSGWLGGVVDSLCVVAVVAGTVGPIGFLATQVSFGLHELTGISSGFGTQLIILMILGAVYVTSAVTGIDRGIQWLSRFNVVLALGVAAVIVIFGPTLFLTHVWFQGMGQYVNSFFTMATVTTLTAPESWLKWWTVFFFAWFIGYGPLMAIFVARISNGRTIRQTILSIAVLAPLATTVWFTLLGGSGIYYQLHGVIDLTQALRHGQFDVATLSIAQALPGAVAMAAAILVLTTIFVATTGDSMSYAIAVVVTGQQDPHPVIRAFWGIAMALMAAILLFMGHGRIAVLQQFIVITAIPISFVLLPSLWTGPQAARTMARSQGVIPGMPEPAHD